MTEERWPGIWPGTVINENDPKKGGRLRVRVDQVYGADDDAEKLPDADLPWARPCFPVTGDKDGEAWVPPTGAAVWVAFWGGDASKPVWLGGWFPDAKVPAEFASSYEGGPRTRIVKAGGHLIEMRWKAGQEHVHIRTAGGCDLDLVDAPALGGPKIEASTPGGRRMGVDDKLQRAFVTTPTQSAVVDDLAGAINVTSPTAINATVAPSTVALTPASATVTAPTITATATAAIAATAPQVQVTTTTPAGATFSMALLTFATLMTIAFAGALVLTGAALTATFAACAVTVLSLNIVSATVNIGILANVKKLLNEDYDTKAMRPHYHDVPAGTDLAGGPTGPVAGYGAPGTGAAPPGAASLMTTNVRAS